MFDNNSDGKITLSEVLLGYAKEKGIYIDQIPRNVKAEIKQQFEMLDKDNNGYITEEDMVAMLIAMYEDMANKGVPLK